MASAAELPITPPFVATATRIGAGRSQVGASLAARATNVSVAASWTLMQARTRRAGSTRSTRRLVHQPAEMSPTAFTPNATPYPTAERPTTSW